MSYRLEIIWPPKHYLNTPKGFSLNPPHHIHCPQGTCPFKETESHLCKSPVNLSSQDIPEGAHQSE